METPSFAALMHNGQGHWGRALTSSAYQAIQVWGPSSMALGHGPGFARPNPPPFNRSSKLTPHHNRIDLLNSFIIYKGRAHQLNFCEERGHQSNNALSHSGF